MVLSGGAGPSPVGDSSSINADSSGGADPPSCGANTSHGGTDPSPHGANPSPGGADPSPDGIDPPPTDDGPPPSVAPMKTSGNVGQCLIISSSSEALVIIAVHVRSILCSSKYSYAGKRKRRKAALQDELSGYYLPTCPRKRKPPNKVY